MSERMFCSNTLPLIGLRKLSHFGILQDCSAPTDLAGILIGENDKNVLETASSRQPDLP